MKTLIYRGSHAARRLDLVTADGAVILELQTGVPVEVPEDHPVIRALIADGQFAELPAAAEPESKKSGKAAGKSENA
jgi:hypothetical protein